MILFKPAYGLIVLLGLKKFKTYGIIYNTVGNHKNAIIICQEGETMELNVAYYGLVKHYLNAIYPNNLFTPKEPERCLNVSIEKLIVDIVSLNGSEFENEYIWLLNVLYDNGKNAHMARNDHTKVRKYLSEAFEYCFDKNINGINEEEMEKINSISSARRFLLFDIVGRNKLTYNYKMVGSTEAIIPVINNRNIDINKYPESEEKTSSDIVDEIISGNIQALSVQQYTVDSLEDIVYLDLMKVLQSNININRCENCNRYFIPNNRNDEMYCDRIFKGKQTCKQLSYELKDKYIIEYRKAYKNKNQWKNYYKKKQCDDYDMIEKGFKEWVYAANNKQTQARNGNITMKEYIDWLNKPITL